MTRNCLAIIILSFLILSVTFVDYSEAARPSLERRIEALNNHVIKNDGIVELDSDLFDEFLAKPRNYSLVVLLTAMDPAMRCTPCKDFDPEYRTVAKSWQKTEFPSRLYFGILDFKNGREIYDKLKQTTAPSCWYYPATDGPFAKEVSEPNKYDFTSNGLGAEEFARFLSINLAVQVPVIRRPNYFLIGTVIFLAIGILAALKLVYPLIQGVIQSKSTWAAISLVIILMMTSGHMWNQIRAPPYATTSGYIAGGFQNQYGLESQIVAIMYGLCAFSVVSLIITIPKFEERSKQRFGVYLWMGILLITFSLLFALFRIKYPGYPFRLFI